jgi:hypothetical protein
MTDSFAHLDREPASDGSRLPHRFVVFFLIFGVTRAVGRRELSSMEPFDMICSSSSATWSGRASRRATIR